MELHFQSLIHVHSTGLKNTDNFVFHFLICYTFLTPRYREHITIYGVKIL